MTRWRIDADRYDCRDRRNPAGGEPCRRRVTEFANQFDDSEDRKRCKTQSVEHAGDDRGEPHNPADQEGSFEPEDLAGKGVGAAGLRKRRGKLGETQCGDQRDHAVQGECEDGTRSGFDESHTGQRQDAAADNGADADQGRAGKSHGSLYVRHVGRCR